MNTIWQEIRYGLRTLGKNPGFTAIAVFTLALGIGANVGIFSVMQQVLLQRLPVRHPEQLALVYSPGPKSGHVSSDEVDGSESFSYPMYKDLRDQLTIPAGVLSGLVAKADFPVSLTSRGQTERAHSELVSGNYFEVLGAQPALGRTLQPADTASDDGAPVVVLGYGYWQKRFGGDPRILNESVLINNSPMTVVGVVNPAFHGVQPGNISDVYIPITMKAVVTPEDKTDRAQARFGLESRSNYWVKLIARMKPGVSLGTAMAAVTPAYHALLADDLLHHEHFSEQQKAKFLAQTLIFRSGARGRPQLENDTGQQLLTLMAMVALVLVIACANVAALQTARGAGRQKEIALRLSLGAGRWRLVRQLIIESCLLSLFGAVLGLVIATWISGALVHFAAVNEVADGLSSDLSLPVLLFAATIAILSGVLFGIAPAFRATQVELVTTLKEQSGGLGSGVTHAALRKSLVIAQVALTLLLVTVAGGFVRSLYNLQHVDLGLQPTHVLQFSVAPELNGYTNDRSLDFFRRLEERLSALPGVKSASGVEEPLMSDDDRSSNINVEGEPADLAGTRDVMRNAVGAGHFSNLGIPLLQGREFTAQDVAGSPKVAIVNESMAKTFFPNDSPLGRHMKFGGGKDPLDIEIVGVVKDSRHMDVKEKPKAFVYIPYTQEEAAGELTYYVRTSQDPAVLAGVVRKTVQDLDASLPVYDERSFTEQIDRQLSKDRLVAVLAALFGGLAALLAAIGIYGLLAYTVTQRTREIGVRIALGASTQRVGNMILGEVAQLVGIGILIGLPLAYGLGRLINSLLYGVKVFELLGVLVALISLGIVALAAGFLPAWRATRVDPMVALRYE
ncbi:MAG: ABC transporter permease [Candidatus Acidiferrum sp.]|jgi:predicted permease